MFFNDKTYELSLSRDYVSRWGMAEAVRELIQNALDSASPFVYQFNADPALSSDCRNTLILRSADSTLSVQSLLLGASGKGDDPDAIGSFGEGYKIALLVLTRLGHSVTIFNGDLIWKPKFVRSKNFGVELLAIQETVNPAKHSGLTVVVNDLADSDMESIRESCLRMQSDIGEIKQTTRGDILMEQPGKLYVGSLFVCKIDAHFGYNIMPKFLRLERDRQTVSSFDLYDVTRDMWYETKEFDRIAVMIDAHYPDLQYAKYYSPEMVREACYQLFMKNNPGAVVAETSEELKRLVASGMERVVVVSSNMYSMVSGAPSYAVQAPRIAIKSPSQRLMDFYDEHKFRMHDSVKSDFKLLIGESKFWKVK